MLGHPDARSIRLDGIEVMLFAAAMITFLILLTYLDVPLDQYDRSLASVTAGFGTLLLVRRFRPSRAKAAQPDDKQVSSRSLGSLVLLGIGWFVMLIAAVGALLAGSIMMDPKFRNPLALLFPAVPLLVGSGLIYAGLRLGRAPSPRRQSNVPMSMRPIE